MVQSEEELISFFNDKLEYNEGVLYWKSGTRLQYKRAGNKDKNGYIHIRITLPNGSNKMFLSHRIIYAIHHNKLPTLIDHKDRNPENNLIENLRDASKVINSINTGIPLNNSSGVKGVSLMKSTGKYSAQIKTQGKKIHLGTFNTIEDAKRAREQGEKFYWSDF